MGHFNGIVCSKDDISGIICSAHLQQDILLGREAFDTFFYIAVSNWIGT